MTKDSNRIPDQPASSWAASPPAHECKGRYLMRTWRTCYQSGKPRRNVWRRTVDGQRGPRYERLRIMPTRRPGDPGPATSTVSPGLCWKWVGKTSFQHGDPSRKREL